MEGGYPPPPHLPRVALNPPHRNESDPDSFECSKAIVLFLSTLMGSGAQSEVPWHKEGQSREGASPGGRGHLLEAGGISWRQGVRVGMSLAVQDPGSTEWAVPLSAPCVQTPVLLGKETGFSLLAWTLDQVLAPAEACTACHVSMAPEQGGGEWT